MRQMVYYVGVDGGGTKTAAVIASADGSIVRTTRLGPGNVTLLGPKGTQILVREILSELLKEQSVEDIGAVTFAFAGAERIKITGDPNFRRLMTETGIRRFTIRSDSESLFYSIFGEDQGILVLAGTGSVCRFRGEKNVLRKVGGWGYLLGDDGSGFDIGRQAIRHAIMSADLGKNADALTTALLANYQINEPVELIPVIYGHQQPQQRVADCARRVQSLAEEGNQQALAILENAAQSLLKMVLQAVEHMGVCQIYNIGCAGGVLKNGSPMWKAFCSALDGAGLNYQLVEQTMHPAAAGVLMAAREHRGQFDPQLENAMKDVYFD